MVRRQRWLCTLILLGLGACGPDEDVELLALPPAERPSPEARLGIPEIGGVWSFAGWEIIEGDSTSLDRTFPSFGELRFATQRLDSIAGTFVLGGTPVPIVGDVRRDGHLTFVTMAAGGEGRFVAGTYQQDTLWLELASILAADEWPRDARAAFVRETPSVPAFAWLRGARVVEAPPRMPLDSLAGDTAAVSGVTVPEPVGQGEARPGVGAPPPAGRVTPTPTPTPAPTSTQPPAVQPQRQPAGQPVTQPPANQPSRPPAQQPAQPPAQQQPPVNQPADRPVTPTPAPTPTPEPAPPPATPSQPSPAEPSPDSPAPLLGDPINP